MPQLSVAENGLLGHPSPLRLLALIDWRRLRERARAALARLGAGHIDVTAQAGDLSTGDRMLVRIASALVAEDGSAESCLYVLDEPTAALNARESERLFAALSRLKQAGAAILYVSHRIGEVMDICCDVTVLRDGRQVMTAPIATTAREALIAAMTGREMADTVPPRTSPVGPSVVISAKNALGVAGLEFQLREGEIPGLAGLQDAGQTEVLRLLLGAEQLRSGSLDLSGQAMPRSPSDAWAHGVTHVPRERRAEGLRMAMAIRPNLIVSHLRDYGTFAQKTAEVARTRGWADQVWLRYKGTEQPVGELSGGNQQKVVFARALAGRPRLLLLEEPTRGVDVGAKAEIHALIRQASADGCAIVLASSDLNEIPGLADRLLYLAAGRQIRVEDKPAAMLPADVLAEVYAVQAGSGARA